MIDERLWVLYLYHIYKLNFLSLAKYQRIIVKGREVKNCRLCVSEASPVVV